MKTLKYSFLGLAMAGALASCQTDYDAPSLQDYQAKLKANTSIADLKSLFADEASIQIPMKDQEAGTPYVIKGRVISSDVSGNIFKSLVLQDETGAISLSINQANMYTNYRVGQEVVVNATGLWGGQYHMLACLGAGANEYGSLVTSRMTWANFLAHSQLNGMPVESMQYISYSDYMDPGVEKPSGRPYCIVLNQDLSTLPESGDDLYKLQSQLVEIPDASFTGGGELTYASKDENISRTINSAAGGTLAMRNSGKSNFFNSVMPAGKGRVRGILSFYKSSPTSQNSGWQLLIRDLDDVDFEGMGTKEKPYTVEDAIAENNSGRTAWTTGYIVGSAKPGPEIMTADNIIYGADALVDNNLVIAPTPDCRDFSQLMIVELPANTDLRKYGNLIDNPQVLGRKIDILGTFNSWMGMHGIMACPGTAADVIIDGIAFGGASGEGAGTEADPYTVNFVLSYDQPLTGVWVTGYVVGFVNGRSYDSGATFGSDTAGADYGNNNLIIAASASDTDKAKAIPVALPSGTRNELGMKANPAILGRKIMFKATLGTYLGAQGLPATTEYKLL